MALKVIVSGAGIGGLALACWLDRIGASTIIVERAPGFQALGHHIALNANGVEMVRRMGSSRPARRARRRSRRPACTR